MGSRGAVLLPRINRPSAGTVKQHVRPQRTNWGRYKLDNESQAMVVLNQRASVCAVLDRRLSPHIRMDEQVGPFGGEHWGSVWGKG